MRLTPLALHRSITPKIISALWNVASAVRSHGFKRTALAQADLWKAINSADPQGLSSAISRNADIFVTYNTSNRITPIALAVLNRWSNGEPGMAILELLLQHGCNPNERLFDRPWTNSRPIACGEPILLRALRHGDFEAAYALCHFGANMDESDDQGLSPFGLCARMSGSADYRREAYARFHQDSCELASIRVKLALQECLGEPTHAPCRREASERSRL